MNAEPTTFVVTLDERDDQEWPDSTARTITRIDGDLADRVRAHYGKTGDVEIHQAGTEGGYSEFTVEWDWEVDLRIGGEVVWSQPWSEYGETDFRHEGLVPKYGQPTRLARHLLDIRDGKA